MFIVTSHTSAADVTKASHLNLNVHIMRKSLTNFTLYAKRKDVVNHSVGIAILNFIKNYMMPPLSSVSTVTIKTETYTMYGNT